MEFGKSPLSEKHNATIIIPARKGSTRFPNKPLATVAGQLLLFRTWKIAQAVDGVDAVYIATDDNEIRSVAEGFGASVLMTPAECDNGTERVFAAVSQLPVRPDVIVNLQGDAVLTPPWVIQAVVDAMTMNPEIAMATPATALSWAQYDQFVAAKAGGRVSGTLVVFDKNQRALYFSKGFIPFIRDRMPALESIAPPIYRHIGLYGYRYTTLERYVNWQPTPLEKIEKLEQLRALENGLPIQIVLVDYRGRTHWSIDNKEDVAIAEGIIRSEGELVLL
jgi:3-deoxy-manno-octulosonate cytidylyltransferase (CMP-KDO synthetase)